MFERHEDRTDRPPAKCDTLQFPFDRVQELKYRSILAGIGFPVVGGLHDGGRS